MPLRLDGVSRAFLGAMRKGVEAGIAGEPESACPYADKRKPSGKLSWSRAFQAAWRDGWLYGARERTQALITLQYWPKR